MAIFPFECFYKCFFLIPASAMTVGTLHIPSGGTAVVLYMPPLPLVFPPLHCILCSAVRASSLRCAQATTSCWGSVKSCPTLTSPLSFQLHLQSGSHPNTHIMLWSFWGAGPCTLSPGSHLCMLRFLREGCYLIYLRGSPELWGAWALSLKCTVSCAVVGKIHHLPMILFHGSQSWPQFGNTKKV